MARDDWTCARCGVQDMGNADRTLSVHHDLPVASGHDPHDRDNLVTLCRRCHGRIDGRRGRV